MTDDSAGTVPEVIPEVVDDLAATEVGEIVEETVTIAVTYEQTIYGVDGSVTTNTLSKSNTFDVSDDDDGEEVATGDVKDRAELAFATLLDDMFEDEVEEDESDDTGFDEIAPTGDADETVE